MYDCATCVQLRLDASIDAPWRFRELWDELNAHVVEENVKATENKKCKEIILFIVD